MVLQNYQNLIEMTSNIIDVVAFAVGFKCPRKIHLNTQWGGRGQNIEKSADVFCEWSLSCPTNFCAQSTKRRATVGANCQIYCF